MPAPQDILARVRVLHEMPGRMRLRYPRLTDPALDREYLRAVLLALPGIHEVRVNPQAASLAVRYDGEARTRRECLALLQSIPREAFLSRPWEGRPMDPANLVSLGLLTLLTPFLPRNVKAPLSWLAALPTLIKGLETLVNRGLKVELLDASAVGLSLVRRDYFTANAVVALLALGRYLERMSDCKSSELLKSLLRPQSETAWIDREGVETSVPVRDLEIGSRVICGPGDMIPVDGRVVRGQAYINKSSITGESVPDGVQVGDRVSSGSVVEEGRIIVLARDVGSHTTMARMSRFLERSLRDQTEPERRVSQLADKLAPLSLGLAAAEFALTGSPARAASVLTVDYSCVLKLAGPMVVKTSMYTAGRAGVLIKGVQALEALARADTFIFDKTGTLTTGALEVDEIIPLDDLSERELLALAAGAEEHYSHPVAEAVVREARNLNLDLPALSQVDFVVAHGVSAYVDGERVLVGSHHFVAEDEGIDCSPVEAGAGALRAQGKSILYVAHENHLEGIITLRDSIRSETPLVLQSLKDMGVDQIIVLTGDHGDSARRLARTLDQVDRIHWELRPEDKAGIIRELQARGRKVAFVGDGVNDAPSLVTADVGVCMPSGAELARESARVVLLDDYLGGLVTARAMALRSEKTLRNCFVSTVGLNTSILLAAGLGRLSPLGSAVLHNLSTIGILGYAARAGLVRPSVPAPARNKPSGRAETSSPRSGGRRLG